MTVMSSILGRDVGEAPARQLGDYAEIIDAAKRDYDAAKQAYQVAAQAARDSASELGSLEAEQATLKKRVAEFDGGRLTMPDDEYLAALDRLRLLAGKIAAQRPVVERRQRTVAHETDKLNAVGSGARAKLRQVVAEDARRLEETARAELEKVLK